MSRKEQLQQEREKLIEEKGVICFENVSMEFPQNNFPAVNDISLNIKKGEFVFVVGDNGSGKSTMLKLILRELKPTEGDVYVMGQKTSKLRHGKIPKFRRNIGFVFQDFRLLPERNVFDNVAFAQRIVEAEPAEIRKNVPEVLTQVGLAGKYKARIDQLSGGEQQRVAIARALVNKPAILLADEPTGNLDPNSAWEIVQLLEEINREYGTTVIVVTHNREIVDAFQKRVVTMRRGVIVSDVEGGEYHNEG